MSIKSFQKNGETLHIKLSHDNYCMLINLIAKKSIETGVSEVSLQVEEGLEVVRCNNKEEFFYLLDNTDILRVKLDISVKNDLKNSVNLPLFKSISKRDDNIKFCINERLLPFVKDVYDATSIKKQ